MRSSGRQRDPVPRPPIEAVLRELGATDVPTGYGWVRMRCPFHEDRNPSGRVNHDLDAYKCFSCNRSGDALKLLKTELGLSYREAMERASNLAPEGGKGHSRTKRIRRASDLL